MFWLSSEQLHLPAATTNTLNLTVYRFPRPMFETGADSQVQPVELSTSPCSGLDLLPKQTRFFLLKIRAEFSPSPPYK